MGFKIESQLELHLMRRAPALPQICCILIKNGLRKIQGNQLNGKANSPAMPRNIHDKVKTNHN
jgi:hypothetical protein